MTSSGTATSLATDNQPAPSFFYYGWVVVFVAALAMSATLPGRTHGLGLITEPLLADLKMDRELFAQINLATALLGAAFCLPVGFLIDRFGVRVVMTIVAAGLGISVVAMARVTGPVDLFVTLLFVRGFGQSALSVVSLAAVGKWFRGSLGMAMGVYAVLLTFGFIAGIEGTGYVIKHAGWREAWAYLGWGLLLGFAPLAWLLQRDSPEEMRATLDAAPLSDATTHGPESHFTLGQALRTPAFWVFAIGTGSYNLVWSGVSLFNESVLKERGFAPEKALHVMAVLTGVGLLANLVAGALTRRERLSSLLGLGMALLTAALAMLPSARIDVHLWLYAAAMGISGAFIMVIFATAWGQLFGRAELGRIQGTAQLISVLFSALGPVLLARCQAMVGAYAPIFYILAGCTAVLSVVSYLVPLPGQPRTVGETEAPTTTAMAP